MRRPKLESKKGGWMSIYRETRYQPDDVRTPNAVKSAATSQATATSDEQYRHLRRNQPVNTPLPATRTWFETLPKDVQPVALMASYARIANMIAATWTDPKGLAAYMDSLLTDRRGNRRGFPADVLRELMALALQAQNAVPKRVDASAWGDAVRLGRRKSRDG
jgi:hypothetical protein